MLVGTNLSQHSRQGLRSKLAESQEVGIAGRAGCVGQVDDQEHGSLQDKRVGVTGASDPKEKPLYGVSIHQALHVLIACRLTPSRIQPHANFLPPCLDVFGVLVHWMASR